MWPRGEVVVRREVRRGRPWLVTRVRVVEDTDDLLATYMPEGTAFEFPPFPDEHPWKRFAAWRGHGVLMLQRPGEAHAVWVFWEGRAREFAGWYVNLQQPFRRTPHGFDTLDHELDIWIPRGGGWRWKDEELLEQRVREGRFTEAEAAAIRAEGERVATELDAGRRWWAEGWARWQPDTAWLSPDAPTGHGTGGGVTAP